MLTLDLSERLLDYETGNYLLNLRRDPSQPTSSRPVSHLPPIGTILPGPSSECSQGSLKEAFGHQAKTFQENNYGKESEDNQVVASQSGHSSTFINFEEIEYLKWIGEEISSPEVPSLLECRWEDCWQLFKNQKELVKHIEDEHVEPQRGEEFPCYWSACPRRHMPFNARYKLLIHMRVHSGEKPNKCSFTGCTKAFSRLENLKIHQRSHTGERPYTCQYAQCHKSFSNSSDRAKHQRTHVDTKPYACQVEGCLKRYTDPSSLRKHTKTHVGQVVMAKPKKLVASKPIVSAAELRARCTYPSTGFIKLEKEEIERELQNETQAPNEWEDNFYHENDNQQSRSLWEECIMNETFESELDPAVENEFLDLSSLHSTGLLSINEEDLLNNFT